MHEDQDDLIELGAATEVTLGIPELDSYEEFVTPNARD